MVESGSMVKGSAARPRPLVIIPADLRTAFTGFLQEAFGISEVLNDAVRRTRPDSAERIAQVRQPGEDMANRLPAFLSAAVLECTSPGERMLVEHLLQPLCDALQECWGDCPTVEWASNEWAQKSARVRVLLCQLISTYNSMLNKVPNQPAQSVQTVLPPATPLIQSPVVPRIRQTQQWVDAEIRRYRKRFDRVYASLADAARTNRPGARRAAQQLFGRNALKRTLKINSASLVSASDAWKSIKSELCLETDRGEARRIGLEIAMERKATRKGNLTEQTVLDRELEARLAARGEEGAALREGLAASTMTTRQVEEILRVLESIQTEP